MQALPETQKQTITGLILAGGAGKRVGHRDKGLISWRGKPFIAHISDALKPQVKDIVISCNRNFRVYEKFCSRTVADKRLDYQGPLAGLEAASGVIRTELLIVVSCDTPGLPPDLSARLIAPLLQRYKDSPTISYAHDGLRAQYLCAAMKRTCLTSLPAFLDGGERAVRHWYESHNAVAVDFSDQQACFRNYNTVT